MDKLDPILKAVDNLSEWTGKIVSFFVYAIAALMITEIIVRNLFNISLVWVPDYTMFLFSFLILSGGYTLLHGRMIRMDILHSRWSRRTKAIVDLLVYGPLFFLFCGLMLWEGRRPGLEIDCGSGSRPILLRPASLYHQDTGTDCSAAYSDSGNSRIHSHAQDRPLKR